MFRSFSRSRGLGVLGCACLTSVFVRIRFVWSGGVFLEGNENAKNAQPRPSSTIENVDSSGDIFKRN